MSDQPGFVGRQKNFVSDEIRKSASDMFAGEEERLRNEIKRIKNTWLQKKEEDISWFKEAFYYQYNLITLGGLIALAAASGPLMPLIGSVALAWEALWLGLAPSNERFRRMIRAHRNAALLEVQENKRGQRLKDLPLDLQMRHEEAVEIANEIRSQAEQAEKGELDILDETIAKLDYLLDQYADMLASLHRTTQLLKDPEAATLPAMVASLEVDLETSTSGRVRQAKAKNLAILRQRAQRFEKSAEEREYLEVTLNTLENTLKLVRDRVIAANTAGAINSSLDDVVLELSEHRDFMEAVEAELHEGESVSTGAAPELSPFEGTAADPVAAPPVIERDISAPPAAPPATAPDEEERPPGILEEWARE